MATTSTEVFSEPIAQSAAWLDELTEIGGYYGPAQAYSALRAVLHTLRDRLVPEQAAHLAAQMPMLIRGLFFEGWKPSATPTRLRSLEPFLDAVCCELGNAEVEPESACRAVFGLLSNHIAPGEIEQVRHMLPGEVRALWE